MKIWLVGSGYWGSKIAATLEKLDIEYTVIDIKNGQTIDDINTPDPVILATPLWEHYLQAKILIQRGHDVYIEKPAADSATRVRNLIKEKRDDQVVMVGHIYMFNPMIEKVKEILDSGILGEVTFVNSVRTNLGIYQTHTTPVLSLAPHDFSILQYLFGDLKIYDAKAIQLTAKIDQMDKVWIFGVSNSAVEKKIGFNITVSWLWPERKRELTIIGDDGQLVWDDDEKTIRIYKNNVVNGKLVTNVVRTSYHDGSKTEPLENELQHFIDCVKNRTNPKTDLEQALKVAYYIDAVHELFNVTV